MESCPLRYLLLPFFYIYIWYKQEKDATKPSKADQIMAKSDTLFYRNRYQPNNYRHQTENAPVTGKCYIPKKRKKWHLYVPDFQVFVQRRAFGHRVVLGQNSGKTVT